MPNLETDVRELSRRVADLETENARLKAERGPRPARFDRRGLLRLGGAAAAVGAGSVLLRPSAAGASVANLQYGTTNNAGTDGTTLTSSVGSGAFHIINSGTDINGAAVYGEMTDPAAQGWGVVGLGFEGGGVQGSSGGSGPGVLAIAGSGNAIVANSDSNNSDVCVSIEHDGTGIAVVASITDASSKATSIRATSAGFGAALEGSSAHGYGARLSGALQLRLIPGSASTHPHSGSPGVLFVDHSARLWYCKGGTSWHQLA
jgi:hypothetical protein